MKSTTDAQNVSGAKLFPPQCDAWTDEELNGVGVDMDMAAVALATALAAGAPAEQAVFVECTTSCPLFEEIRSAVQAATPVDVVVPDTESVRSIFGRVWLARMLLKRAGNMAVHLADVPNGCVSVAYFSERGGVITHARLMVPTDTTAH